jgi:DNA-binding CsgD family transcriptional regulator
MELGDSPSRSTARSEGRRGPAEGFLCLRVFCQDQAQAHLLRSLLTELGIRFVETVERSPAPPCVAPSPPVRLSASEAEVIRALVQYPTITEGARHCCISVSTFKKRLAGARSKLGVTNSRQLVVIAFRLGLAV